MQREYHINESDSNIKKITTRTSRGYGMDNYGKYFDINSGESICGYVKMFSFGYSHLHVSPYYTSAENIAFRAVAGHELIHAYHHFLIPNLSRNFSERVAFKYSYDTYMGAGQFHLAFKVYQSAIFKGYWGIYPNQYQIPTPYDW